MLQFKSNFTPNPFHNTYHRTERTFGRKYASICSTIRESDNEDAPESLTFSIQKLEADRTIAEAIERKARKEKNHELDKPKERSAIN